MIYPGQEEIDLHPEPKGVSFGWMVSFADLLALLLTFFVMVFSMNAVQYEDWEAVVNALSDELNPADAKVSREPIDTRDAVKVYRPYAISLDYLDTILSEKMRNDPLLGNASLQRLDDRLVVSLPTDLAFDPEDATLLPAARDAIATLGQTLRNLQNDVIVAGHTDRQRVNSAVYPSNWELTMDRAAAVAEILTEAGYPRGINVLGYGASRFDELDPTLPLDQRYALARRVDLLILDFQRDGVVRNY